MIIIIAAIIVSVWIAVVGYWICICLRGILTTLDEINIAIRGRG